MNDPQKGERRHLNRFEKCLGIVGTNSEGEKLYLNYGYEFSTTFICSYLLSEHDIAEKDLEFCKEHEPDYEWSIRESTFA